MLSKRYRWLGLLAVVLAVATGTTLAYLHRNEALPPWLWTAALWAAAIVAIGTLVEPFAWLLGLLRGKRPLGDLDRKP